MTRLLVLFALIAVVFWLAARRAADLAARLGLRRSDPARQEAEPQAEKSPIESMVECPVCGIWQPGRRAKGCGRNGCPY